MNYMRYIDWKRKFNSKKLATIIVITKTISYAKVIKTIKVLCQPFSPSVVKLAGDVEFAVWEDSFLAQDSICFRTKTKSPHERSPGEVEKDFQQLTISKENNILKFFF